MLIKALVIALLSLHGAPHHAPSAIGNNEFQEAFLKQVNAYRTQGCKCGGKTMPGVPPLRWNDQLAAAARRHARDMADNAHFSHRGTDNSTAAQRITKTGYQWQAVAENIAWGYESVEAVVSGWIKSKGHCANIMSADYTEMGAARQGTYWVQTFGKPK